MKQKFPIEFKFLGLLNYQESYDLQIRLRDQRLKNEIPDHILFLEHPPVITMGRRPSHEDLKVSREELFKKGISFVETDRGGKLTYHGPGQLVIYFIVDIEKRGLKISEMVWKVEEGIRLMLHELRIAAVRDERNPGLWVGHNKIASIGLHVHKGVTTHGASLNVHGDLSPFSLFTPCGLAQVGMTSIKKEINTDYHLKECAHRLESIFKGLL